MDQDYDCLGGQGWLTRGLEVCRYSNKGTYFQVFISTYAFKAIETCELQKDNRRQLIIR